MRITRTEVVPRRIPLTTPYRIAGRSHDTAEIVFVVLEDDAGLMGYGAASPVKDLTGDDFESARRALEGSILPAISGADVSDLDRAVARAAASNGARSALAAVDIALHDLHAKRLGLPLVRMLGGAPRPLLTSVTVGIDEPEVMAEAARRHVERGFRAVKVKIGEDAAADRVRLRTIRAAVGPGVRIRVDANGGYDADQALAVAEEAEALSIELFEQPVGAADLSGMRRVSRAARIPVVADEAVKVAADLPALIEAGVARGANIKLMKCGGIAEARRIDRALLDAGWSALVGCMDESRVSIAAAAHFAAAAASVAWVDLDGHLDLVTDPFSGGFEIVNGEIVLGKAPGLGVTLGPFT